MVILLIFPGIPTVMVIKVSNGEVITKDGRKQIEEQGSSAFAQWEWDHGDDEEDTEAHATSAPPIDESMFKSALEQQHPPEAETDTTGSDRVSIGAESLSSDNAMFDREDFYGDGDVEDGTVGGNSGPQWTWLTNGSCKLDPTHLPGPWFIENIASQSILSNEAWRTNILEVRNLFYTTYHVFVFTF